MTFPIRSQHGVTLIEMMVGLAVGLMVVAVAMGALMASRNVSGTVSDASVIQQQAAFAMRAIGLQVRQAGSLYLNPDPAGLAVRFVNTPVAFETGPAVTTGDGAFDPDRETLFGGGNPVTLTVGYRRYAEPVNGSAEAQFLSHNCLGGPKPTDPDEGLTSRFQFSAAENTLRCSGNGDSAQPLVRNLAEFQLRYLLQDNATAPGDARIRYVTAEAAAGWTQGDLNWSRVQAVEVCLVLFGDEAIDLPADSSYIGCGGSAVSYGDLTGTRARRMHIAFRNVFQLRSQGLKGNVL